MDVETTNALASLNLLRSWYTREGGRGWIRRVARGDAGGDGGGAGRGVGGGGGAETLRARAATVSEAEVDLRARGDAGPRARRIAGVGGCRAAAPPRHPSRGARRSAAVGSGARKSGGDAIRWRRAAAARGARASPARDDLLTSRLDGCVCTLQTIGYDGGWRSRDSPRRRGGISTRETPTTRAPSRSASTPMGTWRARGWRTRSSCSARASPSSRVLEVSLTSRALGAHVVVIDQRADSWVRARASRRFLHGAVNAKDTHYRGAGRGGGLYADGR